MSTTVVVAADGAAWESALLNAADARDLGISVVRRCRDVVELISVALAGQVQVALVAYALRDLDRDVVDQLTTAGVTPVAVVELGDASAADGAAALGLRRIVQSNDDPERIAAVVRDAAAHPEATDPHSFALAGPSRPAQRAEPLDQEHANLGRIVAIWGPTGAPGRTTVALGLADEIARLGAEVLLVDADVYGGTAATRLGILDESPGLAAACRAVSGNGLDRATLAGLAWQLGPRMRVLTGLPLPQRWSEVRPTALKSVLTTSRSLADWVVVDLGFSIESDEELSFDSIAPRRNGATLTVLDVADATVVVGDCDPIGMQRLAYSLIELGELDLVSEPRVVLNKVRPGFGSGDPRAQGLAALRLSVAHEPAAYLPYDREAIDACLMGGRSLREVRPRSKLRQAVAQLAQDLTGLSPPTSHRHARR